MPKIYVVATPIGNIKDITLRAIEILKGIEIIACEDTRNAKKLLQLISIDHTKKKYIVYNDFASQKTRDSILEHSKKQDVVLISDAGSPLISDPGYKLIRFALENHIDVECIPGPSSVIAALTMSGLPTDSFYFYGFLDSESKFKKKIANIKSTIIIFESTKRIIKTIDFLGKYLSEDTWCAVSFELTKKFENTFRGPLSLVLKNLKAEPVLKGECVITVDTRLKETEASCLFYKIPVDEMIKHHIYKGSKNALVELNAFNKFLVNESDQQIKIKKNELYQHVLDLKSENYVYGLEGESKACEFLKEHDYIIVYRRQKTPHGEIDIIAKQNQELVFFEVKSSAIKDKTYYALSEKQKLNIKKSVLYILEKEIFLYKSIRVDFISVNQGEINHIKSIIEFDM